MEITSTTATTQQQAADSIASSKELSDQFLHLLVTQLKNQDPLEPMENEQFISELAQLQALDSSLEIAKTNQALLLQSSLATGASMIGKVVNGLVGSGEDFQEVMGVVQSVKVVEGDVAYTVITSDGETVEMDPANILELASISE